MFYSSGSSELPGRCPGPAGRGANSTPKPQQLKGAMTIGHCMLCLGHKITLTSNTGEGQKSLVPCIRRVTIFYADVKGGVQFFNLKTF